MNNCLKMMILAVALLICNDIDGMNLVKDIDKINSVSTSNINTLNQLYEKDNIEDNAIVSFYSEGKLIKKITFNDNKNQIISNNFDNGTYFVRTNSNGISILKKIVITGKRVVVE